MPLGTCITVLSFLKMAMCAESRFAFVIMHSTMQFLSVCIIMMAGCRASRKCQFCVYIDSVSQFCSLSVIYCIFKGVEKVNFSEKMDLL